MAYRYAFIDPFASALSDTITSLSLAPPDLQKYASYSVAIAAPSWSAAAAEEATAEDYADQEEYAGGVFDKADEASPAPPARAADAPATTPSQKHTSPLEPPVAPSSESIPAPPQPQEAAPIGTLVSELDFAGKGVVAASSSASSGLLITLSTPDSLSSLVLSIGADECSIGYGSAVVLAQGAPAIRPFPESWVTLSHDASSCLFRPLEKTTYWLSLDETNGSIKYGKHYLSANLKLLEVTFKKVEDSNPVAIEAGWEWMKDLKTVTVQEIGASQSPLAVSLRPLPLVHDRPPYVIPSDQLSLADLEANIFTVVGNLPRECQQLYANIAGAHIVLNTPDFDDFDEAIQYSVNTPGCVGHNLLTRKARAHGGDFAGTYLRITIGFAVGTSPGVPYVLEIWPAGHHSPIHDHGNSFAVIKVLSGRIFCDYYDALRKPREGAPRKLAQAELRQGDITWMSNHNYQVHQLRNRSVNGRVCCTLQCYQYGDDDRVHDEHFHFLSSDPDKEFEDFDPKSDMSFTEFRRRVQAEWVEVKARLQT